MCRERSVLPFRHWTTDHQIPFMCQVSLYDGRDTESTQPSRVYIHTVEILVSHSQSSALTESTTNALPHGFKSIGLQRCFFTYRPKSNGVIHASDIRFTLIPGS